MCEIFSTIGTAILGTALGTGAVTASTAATTAIGAATAASTVAGLASAGIGIANGIRSAREGNARINAAQNTLLDRNRLSTERTAAQLKENTTTKRTLTSLRIPLDKTSSGLNTQSSQAISGTGLNIPM